MKQYTLDQLMALEKSLLDLSSNLFHKAYELQNENEARLLGTIDRNELPKFVSELPEVKDAWDRYEKTNKTNEKVRFKIGEMAMELVDEIDKNLEV